MYNRNMRPMHEAGRSQDGKQGSHHGGEPDLVRQESDRGRKQHGGGRHGDGQRGGRRGGGRGRARRGEARYILLDVLRDGPKHGYEIIKTLEERSAGHYIPSPGTVYPTLQYLEEQGLVHADQEAERRVYELTDAGKAELDVQAEAIAAFWSRYAESDRATASRPEVRFLEDELEHLNRIVWSGLSEAIAQGDDVQIRRVREVVEVCQNQVRQVITSKD